MALLSEGMSHLSMAHRIEELSTKRKAQAAILENNGRIKWHILTCTVLANTQPLCDIFIQDFSLPQQPC